MQQTAQFLPCNFISIGIGRSGGRSSGAICGFAHSSWRVGRNEHRALSRLPIPASAITQPIGQGVPSAKAPTSAEPMMPRHIGSRRPEPRPHRPVGEAGSARDRVGDDEAGRQRTGTTARPAPQAAPARPSRDGEHYPRARSDRARTSSRCCRTASPPRVGEVAAMMPRMRRTAGRRAAAGHGGR